MTDSLDELIRGMYERALEWERKQQERMQNSKLNALTTLGLRENEAKGWLENEPDFTQPIAKRKRKGDVMLAIILLALTVPHLTVQAASPTESLHQHVPTVKATLPNFW